MPRRRGKKEGENPKVQGMVPQVYKDAIERLVDRGLYASEADFVRQAVREKIDQYHQDVVTAVAFDRDSEHD